MTTQLDSARGKPSSTHPRAGAEPERGYSIDTVLECSRGLAALWVFMFHIAGMFESISPALFEFASYGHYGVPLFFAISGYCMFASAESTIAKRATPGSFLSRRLLRVLPPFWLSILVVLAVPYVIAAVSAGKSGRFDWPLAGWMDFGAIDWLQLVTLTRAFFHPELEAQAAFTPVNAVYWTLAIELQFYLVMAAALMFRGAWKRVVVAVLGLSLATLVWNFSREAFFLQYWPAFALGMALRVAHVKGLTPVTVFGAREVVCSLLGAVILLVGAIALVLPGSPLSEVAGGSKDVAFLLAALLSIVFLWLLGGIEHGVRSPGHSSSRSVWWGLLPLCWLGQSSYSLYLLHGKLYQLPAMFVRQVVSESSIWYPALTIVATAVLCHAFYMAAERPFQHGKRVYVQKARTRPLVDATVP